MVEMSDAEFMIIKEFIDAIELDPNTPEELVKKYTDALQVVNEFGQAESAEVGTAAPA
jgi:tRNA U34 5-methylaminomethyl-2-thiouridine-forming methyltransferase MnmC